jgi:hypothetical protein
MKHPRAISKNICISSPYRLNASIKTPKMTQSSSPPTDLFDVTFLVGPERQPVRAHKFALAISSDVFKRMFYSNFRTENEIKINDINIAVFKIMLNHIYHREFVVNAENINDVFYAADKYNLTALKKVCSQFVSSMTTTENAAEVLGQYQHFNSPIINDKCLSIISDDPLNFFKSDTFVTLESDVIRTIFKQPRLNCSVNDMKSALLNWLSHNQFTQADIFGDEHYEVLEELMQVSKLDILTKLNTENILRYPQSYSYYANFSFIREKFVKNNVFIHGIGLILGLQRGAMDKELVTITFFKNSTGLRTITQLVQKDEPKNCCTIQEVFFEKVLVKCDLNETFNIEVKFQSKDYRSCLQRRLGQGTSVISYVIYTEINPEEHLNLISRN